jgi:hypothetical protein
MISRPLLLECGGAFARRIGCGAQFRKSTTVRLERVIPARPAPREMPMIGQPRSFAPSPTPSGADRGICVKTPTPSRTPLPLFLFFNGFCFQSDRSVTHADRDFDRKVTRQSSKTRTTTVASPPMQPRAFRRSKCGERSFARSMRSFGHARCRRCSLPGRDKLNGSPPGQMSPARAPAVPSQRRRPTTIANAGGSSGILGIPCRAAISLSRKSRMKRMKTGARGRAIRDCAIVVIWRLSALEPGARNRLLQGMNSASSPAPWEASSCQLRLASSIRAFESSCGFGEYQHLAALAALVTASVAPSTT